MAIFSLFSMILFTVFASVYLSSSAVRQYQQMMKTMMVKQSQALETFFESYSQRLEKVTGNPAVIDFIEAAERLVAADDDDSVNEKLAKAEIAERALEAMLQDGSGITGVTIFHTDNEGTDIVVLSVGSDRNSFILSSPMRNRTSESENIARLRENQFAATPTSDNPTEQHFEIVQYQSISETHTIILSFGRSDIEMLFFRSILPSRGKLLLICPLDGLLDQSYRGNLGEGGRSTSEYLRMTGFLRHEENISGTEFFSYEVGRAKHRAIFNRVGDTGWLLGIIANVDDMYTYSGSAMERMIYLTIFLGLGMVALGVVFSLKFTKPLITIKDTLAKVRRGDHDIKINITVNNEYGDIAKEFNTLLDTVVVGEGRYKTVVETSDNIIFEWNFKSNEVNFSNNFGKKFSYRAPTDSYEDSFLVKSKVHPEDTGNYKAMLDRLSKGEQIKQEEFRWKNIFGDYVWVLLRACPIHGTNDEIMKVVGVIIDIDRAKKSEMLLSARASYDALTKLYNRETLEGLINNEIELIAVRKNEFAILFIDVDDFKFFNDNYSHATGDQVLQFTATSINDIVSKYGMAGRFGGDEFVVCIRNSEINDPSKTAEEILEKLKDGFVCDVGDRLTVNVSIGIAIIRDTAKRVDEIIGMADEAMYKIKKSGKSNYGFIN
jgi:diguanylate cyclase (GGDEF)-like protein/PAS domain S-box-containing protein